MEIQDFKPKDPTDTPNTEGATAVKEAVAEEAPVADEVIVEEEPSLTVEGKTVTPTELAESLFELVITVVLANVSVDASVTVPNPTSHSSSSRLTIA